MNGTHILKAAPITGASLAARAWRPALHQSFMANCVQCGRQLPGLSFGKKLCQWCVQNEAAKRGEDSPIQRVEPAPWVRQRSSSMAVTQAIFGINVAVFAAMALAGVSMLDNPSVQDLVHWGANFGPLTVSRSEERRVGEEGRSR